MLAVRFAGRCRSPAHPGKGAAVSIIIEEFVPVPRNSLRGFARVRLPSGLVLHDVSIHVKGDSSWVAPSSKPMIARDGPVIKGPDGKIKYSPVVSFATKELRDKFSASVIAAMRAHRPDMLE
jgi:hypothetical protein